LKTQADNETDHPYSSQIGKRGNVSNDHVGFESVRKRQKYYEGDQVKPSLSLTAPAKGVYRQQHRATSIVKSINFDLTDMPLNDEFPRKQLFGDEFVDTEEKTGNGNADNLLFERLGVNNKISFSPENLDKSQQITALNQRITRQICTDMISFNKLGGNTDTTQTQKLSALASSEANSSRKFICIPNFYEMRSLQAQKSVSTDTLIRSLFN
jgi:hypothetical protein